MNKIKITLEIESKKERQGSKLEKLINTFVRLASTLRPAAMFKLLRLIVVLIALTYILSHTLPIILNYL